MSVLIKDMEMPTECHGCRWFYFQGTSCTEPKYYLDARCKMVESGQDWYGKDARGGWIGASIEHIPGWTGYYPYKHCVEMGTRASQCPLRELPSAQPDNQIHLCDSCEYNYPECPCKQNDVIFGNGKGNDNICACNKYKPSAQPEQRWIPVTLETLPNPNSVVVACGKKGTWDYGTYRGWHGDIHSWKWKKNTIKHVYWWMYKDDALPEPYREEGDE